VRCMGEKKDSLIGVKAAQTKGPKFRSTFNINKLNCNLKCQSIKVDEKSPIYRKTDNYFG